MLARNYFVPDPPELGERTGAVAKYARGTDYHQALRERPGLTGMRRNAQIALDNSDKGRAVAHTVTDPALRERLSEIQRRLSDGLAKVDPHHRLRGRPTSYQVISGETFEIVYRDVSRIDEAEVLGVKKLIGEQCFCSVTPQTAETVTVRFVVPLRC